VSIRVVLYAEGSAEHGGEVRLLPAPGEELAEVHLGAAHLLIRRVVAAAAHCPPDAVRFVSPLRIRGRTVRGSDLHVGTNLKKLLAFPMTHRRPHLGIVLTDEDGIRSRRDLRTALENSVVPAALGLATPEFEAWLIADHKALCGVLKMKIDLPPAPDAMAPGAAKTYLANLMNQSGLAIHYTETVRRDLACNCNLDAL
jgi:hypothetical protein